MKRLARLDEEPHIVEDFMLDGTHVMIADNYCRSKTPEDVRQILDRIAVIALRSFAATDKTDNEIKFEAEE